MTIPPSDARPTLPSAMMVELLYEAAPEIDRPELARRAAARAGIAAEPAATIGIEFPDLRIRFAQGDVPLTVSILEAGATSDRAPDWIEKGLRQTWSWDRAAARDAVRRASHALVVADVMAGPLDRRQRLPAYNAVLASLADLTGPIAMHWIQGERFLDPSAYVVDAADDPLAFRSVINVRYMTITDRPGEQLMDTVGLAPFLIPDVQIHFTSLEPGWVAGKLLGIARYLFDNGDIIDDGNTIPGLTADERWHCRHEEPLVGPPRVVLDIDPSPHGPQR